MAVAACGTATQGTSPGTDPSSGDDAGARSADGSDASTRDASVDAHDGDNASDGGDAHDASPDAPPDASKSTATSVTQLVVDGGHSCAIFDDGSVKCWGSGGSGLGIGDATTHGALPNTMGTNLPFVNLGTGRTAKALALGNVHSCALLDDGNVKCWGYNGGGQLGLGDKVTRGDAAGEMGDALPVVNLGVGRTAKVIAARTAETCAILDDGHLKCWGLNSSGALGLGDTKSRGANPDEMGDSLPAVDLGTGRTAKDVRVGADHACAILDNGSVKCWGKNPHGELGQGNVASRGASVGTMGDALPPVNLGTGRTAKSIALGAGFTCAILDNDSLKCWGYNNDGELGLGDTTNRGMTVASMGDALPAVALGTGRTAKSVTCGESQTCAVLDDGSAKCWGAGNDGQLGLVDLENRGDKSGTMGDALGTLDLGTDRHPTAVGASNYFTCAVRDDGQAKCWGLNNVGQLGLGDKTLRSGANARGDTLPVLPLLGP